MLFLFCFLVAVNFVNALRSGFPWSEARNGFGISFTMIWRFRRMSYDVGSRGSGLKLDFYATICFICE